MAHNPFIHKLSAFVILTEAELAVLARLHRRRRTFAAGQVMVHQGQSTQTAYILSAGWVCSCKIQPDGTRQIVDFQAPEDFLGLRSVLLPSRSETPSLVLTRHTRGQKL